MEDPKLQRFNAVYLEYWKVMYTVAYRMLDGQRTAAEDAVQETFRILAEKFDEVENHPDIKKWLLKTVEYVAKNESRKAYRQREIALEPNDVPAVEDAYFRDSGLTFPPGLSEKDQRVLRLCFEEGLSQEESAARLGCSLETFRVWLSRAKSRYKRQYEKNSSG
ncbi:MAG: sigma-70 family RNA polymerase sigma factor [Oscillospiraceae bacterium]|nr:sigma-70 family RNA polymerase sigma factor [Oscillospiraceae bacterium]